MESTEDPEELDIMENRLLCEGCLRGVGVGGGLGRSEVEVGETGSSGASATFSRLLEESEEDMYLWRRGDGWVGGELDGTSGLAGEEGSFISTPRTRFKNRLPLWMVSGLRSPSGVGVDAGERVEVGAGVSEAARADARETTVVHFFFKLANSASFWASCSRSSRHFDSF